MKISKREMTLGVLTLAAVLAGSIGYGVDRKMPAWKEKAAEIKTLERRMHLHKKAIKMQENWLDELNALQAQLPIFDQNKRSVSPELVRDIKKLASNHTVTILKTNPRSEKPTGDLFELGINCTWEGSLDSMVGFLTDLQQQGVCYDVRTLTVAPIGKNTGKLKGNMVVHCAFIRNRIDVEKK